MQIYYILFDVYALCLIFMRKLYIYLFIKATAYFYKYIKIVHDFFLLLKNDPDKWNELSCDQKLQSHKLNLIKIAINQFVAYTYFS